MIRLCSRCKKRPAVIFITNIEIESGKSTPEGLCLHCARELRIKPLDDILKQMNLGDDDLDKMDQLLQVFGGRPDDGSAEPAPAEDEEDGENGEDGFEQGGAATFPFLKNVFGSDDAPPDGESVSGDWTPERRRRDKNKKRKYLDQYCTNLTGRARRGELDRIVGRDRELSRVVQILSRRSKNNPCLIGEPGVGKTAIAEGLALKIAAGDVPARLADKEVLLLDLTALVAGTQFRGQFEARVKGLVEEVKREGDIILFIDEVHNMVGTGDAEGAMNAANILKPALSRGEVQVIGATTFKEYRKYIEKDAALERRFQPVVIEEPSIEDTAAMLAAVKEYYENYHHVQVPEAVVRRAVTLSERYINDRFLPDKAIDLLDEACAAVALRNKAVDELYLTNDRIESLSAEEEELESQTEALNYERIAYLKSEIAKLRGKAEQLAVPAADNVVTEDDLARVVELWTGIPASKIKESSLRRLSGLEEGLKRKIIGQDQAVDEVCAAVRRSRVQISPRRRPASFIFVGPTGVGKTELVKVLAAELFDTPDSLIRLDMSEFMEKHTVSRLIGAPPGYVGYDEAGQLTERVRRKPYSVLLFDEIEKAHPDVLNVLLQILDDGRVTDAQGRTVNFENTILVMTSNAGSDQKGNALGFAKTQADLSREKVMKALEELLRPEFLGRVDEIVVFRPLDGQDYEKIAALMLDELKPVLAEKGIAFSYDGAVCAQLARLARDGKRGARDLRQLVRRQVEDRLAALLVERCDAPPAKASAVLDGGEIRVDAE